MNIEKLKQCCGAALLGGALAWAMATYQPAFVDTLPAGLQTIYMQPLQFALFIGIAILIIGAIAQALNEREGGLFKAETYSLRAPESYGYSGLGAAPVGEPSSAIGFKNFV